MTDAQAAAVTALQWTGEAAVSTATGLPLARHRGVNGTVHWKPAEWLCAMGFARMKPTRDPSTGRRRIVATPRGKRLSRGIPAPWNAEPAS